MWNRRKRFLFKLTRIAISVVTLYGVGIIVYCLWFLKYWQAKVSDMPSSSYLTGPLFINICLAIGIALFLSTMLGYIVANCFSDCMLSIYLVAICFLLLLEVIVVFTVFLKIDWVELVKKYIDEKNSELRHFVLFHISICRILLFISLVPQINALVLTSIMRIMGAHKMSACGNHSVIPDFRNSFLVSRVHDSLIH